MSMRRKIADRTIDTDQQGSLTNLDDWNEEVAVTLAEIEGGTLYTDHWELI